MRRAVALQPDLADAHNNLGNALQDLRQYEEAETCYRRAVELRPGYVEAHTNLGNMLDDLARFDEAEASCRRALELKPDYPEAWHNLGNVLRSQARVDESAACYRRALELRPDFPDARLDLAGLLLLTGDYQRGWAENEARWQRQGCRLPDYRQPHWDGSPLAGRTILLHPEQGVGDMFQCIRYAVLLKAVGASVLFNCPEWLLPIMGTCPAIDRLVPLGSALPPFDFYCPLLSLPRLFGTTTANVPNRVPYLVPDPAVVARWRARLASLSGFKVGIAWQGNPRYLRDRQRSVPLALFARLAGIPGVRLISLQKGAAAAQLAAQRLPVIDWSAELDESSGAFIDTAALMTGLDLVVTVDTAVVHLAGALGVRTWLAETYAPYWTWMLKVDVSPWYPTVKIFRQPRPGDWEAVFARLAQETGVRSQESGVRKPAAGIADS